MMARVSAFQYEEVKFVCDSRLKAAKTRPSQAEIWKMQSVRGWGASMHGLA